MKVRFKLANGLTLERDFSVESINYIEKSKEFKKADRKGLKQPCNYGYFGECGYCFGAKKKHCQEQQQKRLGFLSEYLEYLAKYNEGR